MARAPRFKIADTAQQIVGGFLLAGPFVVTEEVWVLAANMTWAHALAVVGIVFGIGYGALYKADDDRDPDAEAEVAGIPVAVRLPDGRLLRVRRGPRARVHCAPDVPGRGRYPPRSDAEGRPAHHAQGRRRRRYLQRRRRRDGRQRVLREASGGDWSPERVVYREMPTSRRTVCGVEREIRRNWAGRKRKSNTQKALGGLDSRGPRCAPPLRCGACGHGLRPPRLALSVLQERQRALPFPWSRHERRSRPCGCRRERDSARTRRIQGRGGGGKRERAEGFRGLCGITPTAVVRSPTIRYVAHLY